MDDQIAIVRLLHSKDPNRKVYSAKPNNAKGIARIERVKRNFLCYDKEDKLIHSIENTGVTIEYF